MRMFAIISLLVVMPCYASAQLNAAFTSDKAGDCPPATIRFSNSSSGVSASASYQWDFGNGNSSILKDPSAVFTAEGVYTVRLTVSDNGQTSTRTGTITVYRKPTVSFSVNDDRICLPSPAIFTSTSTAGDGYLSSYHWDFGDGQTEPSSSASINHFYSFPQQATVSLTATNNYGCSETMVRKNIVRIYPPLTASFTADKPIHCNSPATVSFTNNSSGPGTITYEWDFGDGARSTQFSPTHTYPANGVYTVTLRAINDLGCVNTATITGLIRVGGFTTSFREPALICVNAPTYITNTSSPVPQNSEWWIDGVPVYSYDNGGLSWTFNTAGDHVIELRTFYGPCPGVVRKTINVKSPPDLKGFIADIKGLCGAPVAVAFRDTTAGAVAWDWSFDTWTTQSTVQAPVYNFSNDGYYNVRLGVTNATGCTSAIVQTVAFSKPLVGIFVDYSIPLQACGSLTVPFEYRSTEDLATFIWSFGDGTTSTDKSPVHTYTRPGSYPARLDYTTINGCKGTAQFYNNLTVHQRPVANFSAVQQVCGNTPVIFNPSLTTGYVQYFIWNFGDNSGQQWYNNAHQYQEEGQFDVQLIAYNDYCSDTITKPAYIKVAPPFAKITSVANTCEGNRGLVTFTDGSTKVQSWKWDFGDGSSSTYNTVKPEVTHEYASSGTYKAVLSVTNGSCTVRDSLLVRVLRKKQPKLSVQVTSGCGANSSVNFTIAGLDPNPLADYSHYGFLLYDDAGNLLNIYIRQSSLYTLPITGELMGLPSGNHRIRVVTTSYAFACTDTSEYVSFTIGGPTAVMAPVKTNECYKSAIRFKDLSTASNNVRLKTATWYLGDGTIVTTAPGADFVHRYVYPGDFYVTLNVTDEQGCTSSTSTWVQVTGPQASFQMNPGNAVQLNTTVNFINTSNAANAPATGYRWLIDNMADYATYSPTHTFPVAGVYNITLIATNTANGCTDTARQVLTVKDFRTGFSMDQRFIGEHGSCPPVLAQFRNTSVNYTRLVWDFGDGHVLENQYAPSHIYSQPGTYVVRLDVYGYNGLQEIQYDTVRVARPLAAISASALEACRGTGLQLNATLPGGSGSYQFDFGNGSVSSTSDSFAVHVFANAGTYNPSLIVTDDAGCKTAVTGNALVIHPDPQVSAGPMDAVVCKGVAAELTATGGITYSWSPATGLNSTSGATVNALPPTATSYRVDATDGHGCKGSADVLVNVATAFKLTGPGETDLCRGSSVRLTVTGIPGIHWIGNTTGLDNPAIGAPLASPGADIIYTAVGQDQYHCYADTLQVKINVRPLPVVNAGNDLQVVYGSQNTLVATGSTDVTRWKWSPADYLSCTTCQSPVSTPYSSVTYLLQGSTAYGCTARDSVFIKAICAEANVFIPTAFTPNNDGKNDQFAIAGYGVSRVKTFRIFNRWGNVIVDRKNFLPGDNNASWNGRYNGIEAESGVYVYMVELECAGGEIYTRKGTVTLIR